jgi:hypothetical protein
MWLGCVAGYEAVAEQPHAAIGEINKVHARRGLASFSISDFAPLGRRAIADAGRYTS